MAAEAFLLAVGEAERRRLRALASTDRAALSAALKASGCAKMGVRLKVELLLQQTAAEEAAASDCVPTAVPDQPSGSFIGASAFVGARPVPYVDGAPTTLPTVLYSRAAVSRNSTIPALFRALLGSQECWDPLPSSPVSFLLSDRVAVSEGLS